MGFEPGPKALQSGTGRGAGVSPWAGCVFFFVSIHPLHILKHPLSLTSHCITHNLHHSPEREGERELAKNWEFFEKKSLKFGFFK